MIKIDHVIGVYLETDHVPTPGPDLELPVVATHAPTRGRGGVGLMIGGEGGVEDDLIVPTTDQGVDLEADQGVDQGVGREVDQEKLPDVLPRVKFTENPADLVLLPPEKGEIQNAHVLPMGDGEEIQRAARLIIPL